ncbi:MAG: non-homologous end-joining DNA ligase, partial [Flavobacteriales bacterium]
VKATSKAVGKEEEKPNERDVKVGRNTVHLTNLNKVFWPKEGYTKGDVLQYYERMHAVLLPHLKDRPQSLFRTPNGLKGPGFFQKDAGGTAPSWVPSVHVPSDSRGGATIDYILCNDLGTLLYMANLGCIELNPWTSRKQHLLKPDHIVLDLDPSDKNTFDHVVEAALAVKVVLDHIKVKGFCKTSGSSGLHIYIPVGGKYTYEQLAPFAKDIMRVVQNMLPKTTTMERSLAKRDKRKIYLDHLQNRKGQTLASVYSIRPKPGATVSTPLEWKEVRLGLDRSAFTIHTVPARVEKRGDLFAGVLGKTAFDLKKASNALNALLEGS